MTSWWRRAAAAACVAGGATAAVVVLTGPTPGPVELCADRQHLDLDELRAEPEVWPVRPRDSSDATLQVMLQPVTPSGGFFWCFIRQDGEDYRIVRTSSD